MFYSVNSQAAVLLAKVSQVPHPHPRRSIAATIWIFACKGLEPVCENNEARPSNIGGGHLLSHCVCGFTMTLKETQIRVDSPV